MSKEEGYKDSTTLTKWVVYILNAQIVVAFLSILSGYLEYKLFTDFQNGIYYSRELAIAEANASDFRQGVVGGLYLIVFLISVVLILKWIHRSNHNARQLGAENMKFTPGWSIGYYFIPILTLWKPYQAMNEIWKASKNPSDWSNERTSKILPIWWGLWLISNMLGQIIFRQSNKAEELSELIDLNLITQVSNIMDIPLALTLLFIVKSITKMQKEQLENPNKEQPAAECIV